MFSKDHSGDCAIFIAHSIDGGVKEAGRSVSRQLKCLIQRKTNGNWFRLERQMGHIQGVILRLCFGKR